MAVRCLVFLLFAFSPSIQSMLCPNEKDSCPSWTTCCLLLDGTYGCCPYTKAQCCTDKIHCCPPGTKCNVEKQSCDSKTSLLLSLPFDRMVPKMVPVYKGKKTVPELVKKDTEIDLSDIKCRDGHKCPQKDTCCQMPLGNYGCCPYSNANCCSDKEHCCPKDYNCDVQENRCTRKSLFDRSPFINSIFHVAEEVHVPIYNLRRNQYMGPGSTSPCAEDNFCSLAGFVCCSRDGSNYCCPPTTKCSQQKHCEDLFTDFGDFSIWDLDSVNIFDVDAVSSLKEEEEPDVQEAVVCPDDTEACPEDETCCLMAGGSYGCCPMPEATCCADLRHCCPNGYLCGDDGCKRKLFSQAKPLLLNRTLLR